MTEVKPSGHMWIKATEKIFTVMHDHKIWLLIDMERGAPAKSGGKQKCMTGLGLIKGKWQQEASTPESRAQLHSAKQLSPMVIDMFP